MALIYCPQCGKSVSDKAVSCPHCGFMAFEQKTNTHNVIKCDDCGTEYEELSSCPVCGCLLRSLIPSKSQKENAR